MARGRHRSTSNVSGSNGQPYRPPTASPQLKRQFAVASDSIYQNNLTVLRRRDTTITSIIDQFSHVCLYSFNGEKWARQGYEGSMFLVEHQDEPTYGMFILNRMGTGDYGRRIYPEDEMEVSGDYLMYRYFPDYTTKRIAMNLPYPLPEEHRQAFDAEFAKEVSSGSLSSPDKVTKEIKGSSSIIGFWMFPTDSREPLKDVLIRLHSYIKQGLPYPDDYRYLQGRRQSGHSKKSSQSSSISNTEDDEPSHPGPNSRLGEDNHTNSEVEKLFAKIQAQPPGPVSSHPKPPAPNWPSSHSNNILHPPNPPTPPVASAPRGLALLDTIFASVQGPSAQSCPANPSPPQAAPIQIVSPKPTSSALPQVLNQDVIYSLLGLASDDSSRASSVAPSTTSSRRSHNRYEGDNEYSDYSLNSDAELSTSSTVADLDDPAILTAGFVSTGIPALSVTHNSSPDSARGGGSRPDNSRRVAGDVTPRVMARVMDSMSPPPNNQIRPQQFLSLANGILAEPRLPSSISPAVNNVAQPGTSRPRALVPFQADSDLWPYPRAPLDERDVEESGLVELDFSDTRALSDPSIFSTHLQKQQKQRQNGKKKSRREREREAIENSWDDPTAGQAQSVDMVSRPGTPVITATTRASVNGDTPTTNGTDHPTRSAAPNSSISSDAAGTALLTSLTRHPKPLAPALSRKQFVQEVLSLIYSDNSFVDRLYEEYASRAN